MVREEIFFTSEECTGGKKGITTLYDSTLYHILRHSASVFDFTWFLEDDISVYTWSILIVKLAVRPINKGEHEIRVFG